MVRFLLSHDDLIRLKTLFRWRVEVCLQAIDLIVCVSSSDRVHRFSYAIGKISLTFDTTWLELERSSVTVFLDHIAQVDAPFDCPKSSIGYSANIIQTLTLGLFGKFLSSR